MFSFDNFNLCLITILLIVLSVSAKENTIRFVAKVIINENHRRFEVSQCEAIEPYQRLVSNQSVKVEVYYQEDYLPEEEAWSCYLNDATNFIPVRVKPIATVTNFLYKTEIEILNIGDQHAELKCRNWFSDYAGPCRTYINIIDNNITDVDFHYRSTAIFMRARPDEHHLVPDVEYYDNSSLEVECLCNTGYPMGDCHYWVKDTNNNITKELENQFYYSIWDIGIHNLNSSYDNKIISCYQQNTNSNEILEAGIRLKYKIKPVNAETEKETISVMSWMNFIALPFYSVYLLDPLLL